MEPKQESKIAKGPIKRGLQFKYFKMIFITVFITMLILMAGVYATIMLVLSTSHLGRYAEMLIKDVLFWINWLIAVVGLIAMFIAGWISLKISRSLTEPIYKLEDLVREEIAFQESKISDNLIRNLEKLMGEK